MKDEEYEKNSKNLKREEPVLHPWETREEFDYINKIYQELNKLPLKSNWIINACMALLAFLITILVQIKITKDIVPHKYIAGWATIYLIFAIAFSIWVKFKFEIWDWIQRVKMLIRHFVSICKKADKRFETNSGELIDELNMGLVKLKEKEKKYNINGNFNSIVRATGFLILGILFVAIYFIKYLFLD